MHQRKNNIARWWVLCALILALSAALAVSPAFARYRTTQDFTYLFRTDQASKVYLLSGDGSPLSGSWTVTEEGSSLPILVTNGSARRDLTVCIRVAATEGIGTAGNLKLTLTQGGTTYTGVPTAIGTGTGFYEDFGSGWVYRFLDPKGREATWLLEGGKLSKLPGTLVCSGTVQPDSSMVQIFVTAVEN